MSHKHTKSRRKQNFYPPKGILNQARPTRQARVNHHQTHRPRSKPPFAFDHVDVKAAANVYAKAQEVDSRNGFVREIRFHGENSRLMKCQTSITADPLVYEYLAGMFVNTYLVPRFPNFIQTYGCYRFSDHNFYQFLQNMRDPQRVLPATFRKCLTTVNVNAANITTEICSQNAKYNCLLLEYVQISTTFEALLKHKEEAGREVAGLLYQIYFALSRVKDVFTHYDLHMDNVLLQKCPDGGYYDFHYFDDANREKVRFKSQYMAKFIDYGMSYYLDGARGVGGVGGSRGVCESLCREPRCNANVGRYENTECGGEFGVKYCRDDKRKPRYNDYHISRLRKNESHDLKLAHQLLPYMQGNVTLQRLGVEVLGRIDYGKGYGSEGDVEYKKWRTEYRNKDIDDPREFGTEESVLGDGGGRGGRIKNVVDLERALADFLRVNDKYDGRGSKAKGSYYIYANGRYKLRN